MNIKKSLKKILAIAQVILLIACVFVFDSAMFNTSAATITTWDFTSYTNYAKNSNLTAIVDKSDLPGLVSNSCSSNGAWIVDGGNLHAVINGALVIKTANNSSFTAVFSSNGSDIRPTIKVSSTSNGGWKTVTPEYKYDTNTGLYTLYIDGIGDGNCYVQYNISGTTWETYWYHKLRTISFNSAKENDSEKTVICADGISVNDEYAQFGNDVIITVSNDITLKAGTLIVKDAKGDRVATERVGFRKGGNGDKIGFTMPINAPVTVELEQYDESTAQNANIGILGVQARYAADSTNGVFDGIRFGTQFRYDINNNTFEISDKTYTVVSCGTIVTRDTILNLLRGNSAREDYFTLDGWQSKYDKYIINIPQTKVYDSCDDYIEFVGGITGLTNKHYKYVFAARGYVVAECDGQQYTFYTDIVTSSLKDFSYIEENSSISGSPNLDYTGQKVGVLTPIDEPEYYDNVMSTIQSGVNATIDEISWTDAATDISIDNYDVIIIPEANTYPDNAADAIDIYLQNGGKLLTLGGPPLQEGQELINGTWMNQEEAFVSTEKKNIIDFSSVFGNTVSMTADNKNELGYSSTFETGAPDGGKALHVTFENPQNWCKIYKSKTVTFSGANSLSFYLKGNEVFYTGLSVSIKDTSGKEYCASIKPTSDWSLISFGEEDFVYWDSTNSKFYYDQHPNFDTITYMSFGLSQTHVPFHKGELHEFWITNPVLQKVNVLGATNIVLDGIAPEYKFFPITNGNLVEAYQNQSFVATRNYTLPDKLFSATARPQGTGYARDKALRFVPLIEVRDEKDLRSGYLAWMFVNSTGKSSSTDDKYAGSVIAGFGTSDATFYDTNGCAAVLDVLRSLLNDYMFVESGATDDIYVNDEAVLLTLGARTRGKDASGLTVEFDFIKGQHSIFTKSYNVSNLRTQKSNIGSDVKVVSFDYNLMNGKPDYVISTIKKDGVVLDTIKHEITFWSPKAESERKYITSANNEFIRDGKVIRFYGVNYVPTSGIAAEDTYFWEHYLSPESFDPDVVYNDLLRLKEIGFNSIGTFIYYDNATQIKSLLWLADICDKLGLYLEVDIRPHADPFDLVESEVIETFEKLHLDELDNIVSFGVAWERSFGTYDGNYGNYSGRKAYDSYWIQWVKDNYGSIANAEAVWGESMPTTASGEYTAVSDEVLRTNTSSKLVAAYRRFADDLVASKHAYVRELFERLAPNHMITARAGNAGCIPSADAAMMGYDFTALAAGMDYLSPEYYTSYDNVEQVIFTNTYSRYSSPDAPVVWKEFTARSTWCGSNFDDPAYASLKQKIETTSVENFQKFMDNIILGHTGGVYLWFSAGGYRYNEKSDCGVINPDGSDRAVTKLVREYRDKFMNRPTLGEADVVITIDRDQYNNSITGIYNAVKDQLLTAVKEGKTVAFKDASANTTTANVSNAAVGGGVASDNNPARWVNGVFQAVYVKQSDGSWKQIKSGDTVSAAGSALEIKVVMTNMSGCEWLSKSNSLSSYVSLTSTEKSGVIFDIALNKNVKQLETYTQEFTLTNSVSSGVVVQFRFGIQGRFVFANPFTFTII